MSWTRREFLQQATLTLAALGLSETGLTLLSDRYQQALAQPTPRKLALLVGINQYPEQVSDAPRLPARNRALNGCLTDVTLQRELLIHRFGFQPSDVLCLTDQDATRQGIEDAFLSHLTEQARSGDVVVFHFSGMGSRVKLGDSLGDSGEVFQTLVPVDGVLPTEENPTINDLFETTLERLLRSLATDLVTAVLDVGYSDWGKALQGNLRVRSRPNAPTGQISPTEVALQERLQHMQQDHSAPYRGTVLSAAKAGQIVAEAQWNGFSAGLFTYALTQQLWAATPATALRISLSRTAAVVEQQIGNQQQPQWSTQKQPGVSHPAYDSAPDSTGADGVITAVETSGNMAQVWLAGVPAIALENYGVSLLTCFNSESVFSQSQPLLQLRSREGLNAVVTLVANRSEESGQTESNLLQVGQLVQEAVRVLPRDIGLTVALDSSLERIERVDATSAFAGMSHVVAVAAAEQPSDYLFGKVQPVPALTAALPPATVNGATLPRSELPPVKNGYGLFYLGRAAIPNTLVETEEAVKTAVNRLAPQLRTLLATKLLRLTENSGSSRLGVRASLETITASQNQVLLQQETIRAPWRSPAAPTPAAEETILTLPVGTRIQYRLQNYSDRPVYFALIGIDSNGGAIAFYPLPASADQESATANSTVGDRAILPGMSLLLPQAVAAEWVLHRPAGLAETHLIFSRSPLTQTFAVLAEAMSSLDNSRRINALPKPLEAAQAILQDLHQASITEGTSFSPEAYALDVNCWATLSFVYHVADPST